MYEGSFKKCCFTDLHNDAARSVSRHLMIAEKEEEEAAYTGFPRKRTSEKWAKLFLRIPLTRKKLKLLHAAAYTWRDFKLKRTSKARLIE